MPRLRMLTTLALSAAIAATTSALMTDATPEHAIRNAFTPGVQLNGCTNCWPSSVAPAISWEHLDLGVDGRASRATGGDMSTMAVRPATTNSRLDGWQPDWNDVARPDAAMNNPSPI